MKKFYRDTEEEKKAAFPTRLHAKKSLGQNFLRSSAVLSLMASFAEEHPKATIVEIGPGKGALTDHLLSVATKTPGRKVIAVEKDHRLIPLLQEKYKRVIDQKVLSIIEGDIDKLSFDEITEKKGWLLVANIPYYLTGGIIRNALTAKNQPKEIVIMVQKEVADRIARSKKESILSLSVKAYGTPKYVKTVSRKLFSPSPNVDSAILRISDISRSNFQNKKHEERFFQLIRAGFAHKRKRLLSNIKQLNIDEKKFLEIGLDKNVRAEEVSLQKWLIITKLILS